MTNETSHSVRTTQAGLNKCPPPKYNYILPDVFQVLISEKRPERPFYPPQSQSPDNIDISDIQ